MKRMIGTAALMALVMTAAVAQQERKLSLQEALKTAVEQNLDIQLQRVTVDTTALALDTAREVAYEPTVTSNFSLNENESEATTRLQGVSSFTDETTRWNSRFQKAEPFGFGWQIDFNNSLQETNRQDAFPEFYNTSLSFSFQQQLLQGFALDREILRNQEYIAQSDLAISQYDLKIQVMTVLQNTENAYWDLVAAIEQYKVAESNLSLAKRLYEQNKVKVDVGSLAPIELVSNEATIATRESEIITAENNVRAAEDALKRVLNTPPAKWADKLVPSDPLTFDEMAPSSPAEAYQTALSNRPELLKNSEQRRKAQLTLKNNENQLLPQLNVTGAYFSTGTSRPDFDGNSFVGSGTWNEALNEARFYDFPGWNVGLNLTWRPFNKQAKINMAQARVDIRRQDLLTEQTKLSIVEEIGGAFRELESGLKQITANENNVRFREENLKAEEQRFQNGLSTNYLIAERQNELADARSRLIQSKIDYLKAKVRYHKALGQLDEQRKITVQ